MSLDNLWTFLLAASPFLGFLLWATWWLLSDWLRERRHAQAVSRFARLYRTRSGDR